MSSDWQPADPFPINPLLTDDVAQPPLADLRTDFGGFAAPVAGVDPMPAPPAPPIADGGAFAPPPPAPFSGDAPLTEWKAEGEGATLRPKSAMDVLTGLSEKVSQGAVAEYQPVPLGFSPLDRTLGGGIRSGELMLIGGAQGTGKTTLSLQIGRNIAQSGQANVLYICFEHDEEYLLNRMMAMESALAGPMPPTANSGVRIQDVRREVLGTWLAQGAETNNADLRANPRLRPALERISRYGQGLYLMRGTNASTTPGNLRRLVEDYRRGAPHRPLVVFVDYLQRVPVYPDPPTEAEKVTAVVAQLKDMALGLGVAVVCVVAADKEGLKAARLRNHHLRGSSALNYESDVILILNEKYHIVAKVNIEFNPHQAQRFRNWTIVSVEKNRAGRDAVDLEFEKHFEYSCFNPNGRQVQEKLIEERLYNDT
ncbi:MAG TPA: DnaB-like helicase C-terminal domain-containing protein [Candidatus Limnocylindrales bacterium]|nr:DnaB-like helicase C-terminal domain-containing protein [Candidatus Limnocylindrales bacterium]